MIVTVVTGTASPFESLAQAPPLSKQAATARMYPLAAGRKPLGSEKTTGPLPVLTAPWRWTIPSWSL